MTRASVLIVLLSASSLLAQTSVSPPPREPAMVETVSVTGSGKVTLTPDRVVFTIGVDTTALTVADAVRQNNEKVARVVAALKAAGATDRRDAFLRVALTNLGS